MMKIDISDVWKRAVTSIYALYSLIRDRGGAHIRSAWNGFDVYCLLPLAGYVSGQLNRYIATRRGTEVPDWKKNCLDDFSAWLAEIPELPHSPEGTVQTCDLYSLLTEFAGLRQEIRLQNREQGKALKTLQQFMDDHTAAADLFRTRTRDIAELETRIRSQSEAQVVRPFLDVRDALERGLESSGNRRAASGGWFGRKKSSSDNGAEGYRLVLDQMDRALAACGVVPVKTDRQPFDPRFMNAMHTDPSSDLPEGTVFKTLRGGFVRNGSVIRYADVIVSG